MKLKSWLPWLFAVLLFASDVRSGPMIVSNAGTGFQSIASVYINNQVSQFVYGGGIFPQPFLVTGITYSTRAVGSGGSTSNNFQVSDGTNTCNCAFSCTQSQGAHFVACVNGAGTGCAFGAVPVNYLFSAVGDCTTPEDILGNLEVMGNWR